MTPKLTEYIAAGKTLDADEREVAALVLQEVDESEPAEIDAAWDAEIGRRLDNVRGGRIETISGRETLTIARTRAAARRERRSTGICTPPRVTRFSPLTRTTSTSTTTAASATSSLTQSRPRPI